MATRPPARPSTPALRRAMKPPILRLPRTPWVRRLVIGIGVLAAVCFIVVAVFWVRYGRQIDKGLAGEARPVPRIFARPFEIHAGVTLLPAQLSQRLDDAGYALRPKPEAPGDFSVNGNTIVLITRPGDGRSPETVKIEFSTKSKAPSVARLIDMAGHPVERIVLDAPMLAAIAPGEKQRKVPLATMPKHVVDAVIAIEDRRFFDHPGVDPIRAVGALITNLRGDHPYLVGGSTLTQQIVKNMFLTPDKTLRRKVQEQFMAVVLETRYTKQQILELYLNTVTLGQRGPFEIHGVAEAARTFFGKDVRNVTLAEAALMAGLIQSPSKLSPFRWPDRAAERRNVVLKEMVDVGFITKADADKAAAEPVKVATRAFDDEAPYFVDYVSQLVDQRYANAVTNDVAVDVYTTLDLQMQRFARQAIDEGLAQIDKQLGKGRAGQAQAALVAVDPRTGQVLAFVGGRSYTLSQLNRAVVAKRQPGSAFKPFVYLAAFEKMAALGRSDLTPATIVLDEPTTFKDGENDYTPSNYQNEYDGPITLRRALALSRNIVAIRVAEETGYDQVAGLWQRVGVGSEAKAYPSIALGVFEATPLDIATAYTLFMNGGQVRPLTPFLNVLENGKPQKVVTENVRNVARADTTFLVTNMMRGVLDEGTGRGARTAGFTRTAAGKTGTTNDLRDAWFVGFTPDLLTVVWVGLDNNNPIKLSGSQAALPIWTKFMKQALAGQPDIPFQVPDGITYADIDKDTGLLALPRCPKTMREAFLSGTEPKEFCDVHGGGVLAKLGRWFSKIIK